MFLALSALISPQIIKKNYKVKKYKWYSLGNFFNKFCIQKVDERIDKEIMICSKFN